MMRIEFIQPKLRIEDWRVKLNGRTVGARKQLRGLTAGR
jgi:hypothetical protein